MTTEILEQPSIQEQMKAFVMPPVRIGMMVVHYQGVTREATFKIGFVAKIAAGGRSVHLRFIGDAQPKESVRHVDDPKLRFSEDAALNGSWDYTPEHLEQQARLAKLEEDVALLKSLLEAPEEAKSRKSK